MLLQRVQTLRDAFCTSIFGDFEQVEDLVYTFDEGPSTPITEDMLDSLASEEAGYITGQVVCIDGGMSL